MKRRDTIVRYTAPERINHWITAFCFILAAVSGLGFLFPSFNWLMQIMGTPQLARKRWIGFSATCLPVR